VTEEQLNELERLEKEAEEGPWFADRIGEGGLIIVEDGRSDGLFSFECEVPEAQLIAAMRNALPELLRLARVGMRIEKWKSYTLPAGKLPEGIDVQSPGLVELVNKNFWELVDEPPAIAKQEATNAEGSNSGPTIREDSGGE
jgi:hypothetical protein